MARDSRTTASDIGNAISRAYAGDRHPYVALTEEIQQCVICFQAPKTTNGLHHAYHQIAGVYALLGDTEKAMDWLQRTVDTGFPCWPFFRVDPHLESLREKPAFQQLVADLERTYTPLKIQRL